MAAAIAFVIIMALIAAAMLWLTSQRAQVAPTTLVTGIGAGIALGATVYAVAPLGLSKVATNPWLPGSDIDPVVLLAWMLVFLAPVAAGFLAQRRYTASSGASPPARAVARQVMAAGLVAGLVGALLAGALGTGTIALMLRAAWLRNWLYHGQRQFFGIAGLRSLLHGNQAAIAYSHELTASVDAPMLLVMCVAFPLIALTLSGMASMSALGNAEAAHGGDPPGGGGGSPPPEAVPGGPGGAQLPIMTGHDAVPGTGRSAGFEPGLLAVMPLRVTPNASGRRCLAGRV